MNHNIDIGSLLGTALGGMGGGGAVVFIAKAYLARTLRELDDVVSAMKQVQRELAAITVKLEKIEKNDEIIRRHDRQIAALESQVFPVEGSHNRFDIKR